MACSGSHTAGRAGRAPADEGAGAAAGAAVTDERERDAASGGEATGRGGSWPLGSPPALVGGSAGSMASGWITPGEARRCRSPVASRGRRAGVTGAGDRVSAATPERQRGSADTDGTSAARKPEGQHTRPQPTDQIRCTAGSRAIARRRRRVLPATRARSVVGGDAMCAASDANRQAAAPDTTREVVHKAVATTT